MNIKKLMRWASLGMSVAMVIKKIRQNKKSLMPDHPRHKYSLKEYEEPKIEDVYHQSVSLSPGPDHQHFNEDQNGPQFLG